MGETDPDKDTPSPLPQFRIGLKPMVPKPYNLKNVANHGLISVVPKPKNLKNVADHGQKSMDPKP